MGKEYEHEQTCHTSPAHRTTWIMNVSAILVSYTESHVPRDNANKLFSYLSKVPRFVLISITTLPAEALFNNLLRYLILRFCEMSKLGNWYNSPIALKFDRRISSTTAKSHVQSQSYRSILYQYCGFDTSRDLRPTVSKPLPLRKAERKNGSRSHSCGPAADTRLRPASASQ